MIDVQRTVGLTILKERKNFYQFSVICKNSSYRTLKIASELSVGRNREVVLGCVWVITLLRFTLFVLFLRPGFTKSYSILSFLRSVASPAE